MKGFVEVNLYHMVRRQNDKFLPFYSELSLREMNNLERTTLTHLQVLPKFLLLLVTSIKSILLIIKIINIVSLSTMEAQTLIAVCYCHVYKEAMHIL